MSLWTKGITEGYDSWIGETDTMTICVIPVLGSKVVSLKDKRTNREWLWSSGKKLGNEGYGTSYGLGDESGWDEMLPSIKECHYPNDPWKGKKVPDHGEVWSIPWTVEVTESGLSCKVQGIQFPYIMKKEYSFTSEQTLRIDYKLSNRSDLAFPFQWAAHPLFQVHEGMQLHVPEEYKEIIIALSMEDRLGQFGDNRTWPKVETSTGMVDLSKIEGGNTSFAEKYYFVCKTTEGFAAISDPATGEAVTIRFPSDKVPYLAIWANYGGYGDYYHFAIEPSTGLLDDLSHAINSNAVAVVGPLEEYNWFLEVSFEMP